MGATATYTLDTEFDKDAQAVFERAKKINEEKVDNFFDEFKQNILKTHAPKKIASRTETNT